MSEGVMMYWEEAEVQKFLSILAEGFDELEAHFDLLYKGLVHRSSLISEIDTVQLFPCRRQPYHFAAVRHTPFKLRLHTFQYVMAGRPVHESFIQKVEMPVGCGLDTRFDRVDDGQVRWYDLDVPEVIDLRKQFLAESERVTCISGSAFDPSYDIHTRSKAEKS